jgi:hypothetical protein
MVYCYANLAASGSIWIAKRKGSHKNIMMKIGMKKIIIAILPLFRYTPHL